jgi:hypothetical protein
MDIAVVSVITTGIVGLAAALSPAATARLDRTHQRALQRSSRLYDQRRDVYRKLSSELERDRALVERTWPLLEPALTPPDPLDEADRRQMLADVALLGAADVQAASRAEDKRLSQFLRLGHMQEQMTAQAGPRDPGGAERVTDLLDHRENAVTAVEECQRIIRDELANL